MNRHLLRRALRLPQAAIKRLVTGLLQLVLLANRPARLARSGFVLPTTVLLVLMVVLTATALTYRSLTRSDMAISQREQQVIANAATPALDRARAKIEFIFNKDNRFPSGLPTGDFLASMMLTQPLPGTVAALPNDPFTLPGETRLDINGDNVSDNAWSFVSDNNGEVITYSILVQDEALNNPAINIQSPVSQAKANALVTRTGPLATTEALLGCANARAEKGWQVVSDGSSSALQKNFQVNVFVPNANNVNRTVESFEFQQSRIANRGNKWAAWFRYDMEIFPGAPFNINGAMHTDSNLMVRNNDGQITSYMISSHNSCVYSREASEITVGATSEDGTFQGQIVRGVVLDNQYGGGNARFHTFRSNTEAPFERTLTADGNTDGVFSGDSVTNGAPADIAVNPLVLYTQDRLQHTTRNTWTRDARWDTTNRIRTEGRILNKRVPKPFVDDFFRADNRWGPKPRYSDTNPALNVANLPAGVGLGSNIGAIGQVTDPITGLDGYWERQAVKYGLRLVVGQRLELGNPIEWNFNPGVGPSGAVQPNTDRLYPPNAAPEVGTKIRANEYRQKIALRDNLAAVQGMVVYHHETLGGAFPAACMAMTAHPGTRQSIINSRTFRNYPNAATLLKTDFLRGEGTNGWEFQFPDAFNTPAGFATEIGNTRPLGIALRNLARFAGDPSGGAPSFSPVQDGNVHPAPYLAMWGDFSPLRRIFTEYLDAGTAYANLSVADQATLHSAACTVSMLAYNINSDLAEGTKLLENYTDPPSINPFLNQGVSAVQSIADYLQDKKYLLASVNGQDVNIRAALILIGKNQAWNDTTVSTNSQCASDPIGPGEFQSACDSADFFAEFTYNQWETVLSALVNSNAANLAGLRALAERANTLNILLRDRELGFRAGFTRRTFGNLTITTGNQVTWTPSTGLINPVGQGSVTRIYKSSCDPNIFRTLAAGGGGGESRVALAGIIGCSQNDTLNVPIRFPSLYYLFPMDAHDHDGAGVHQQPDGVNLPVPSSPVTPPRPQLQVAEDYITNDYVKSVNPLATEPVAAASAPYRVVGTDPVTGISAIAAVPKALSAALNTWKVPVETGVALTDAGIDTPEQAFSISTPVGGVGTAISVPFLDKGMVDSREQMAIRTLDINLNRLTNRQNVSDYWLSNVACNPDTQDCDVFTEGIVYAFREDAVREDEIVRPKTSAANSDACLTVANVTSAACRMDLTIAAPKDPPLTAKGISLKPVDFFADPDRRSYGFRLRNGADMSRGRQRAVGMTFVTDNSTYILGDFNLHSTNGDPAGTPGNLIEEFAGAGGEARIGGLDWTMANFYNNRTGAKVDNRFSQPGEDTWRPVEILTDAFTILSAGFLDGAAEDTYIRAKPGNSEATNTSYMNQSRPNDIQTVVRANGTSASVASASPVFIDRNGDSFRDSTIASVTTRQAISTSVLPTAWTGLTDSDADRRGNVRSVPNNAFVNAVFIGGVVPNRVQQSNGGLHNFPRLIEDWNGQALQIAGAFFQLNFATGSTGPYEHDNWQPGAGAPDNEQRIGYYRAPTRRWGYDPGLLYYPPAAAARRFVSVDTPRSEYFRELPADDPYIANLRCAQRVGAGAGFVYDAGTRGTCPPPA